MAALPKHDILVMKDPFDNYKVDKGDLPDLPFRILVIGKTQFAGKTNILGNYLLRPYGSDDHGGQSYYGKDFLGRNMYIFSPSKDTHKWEMIIKYKEIPASNIFDHYDEAGLEGVYTRIKEQYEEAIGAGKKPEHSLVIMDDCSFDGSLRSHLHGGIAKLFCNGRHYLISTMLTSQKYCDILTTCRENYTAMMIFECSIKQMDLIYEDVGICKKKEFERKFRDATKERHDFMVINAKCDPETRYQDKHFRPL